MSIYADRRYYVMTLDPSTGDFTPQKGVRKGPYRLFALRQALRALQHLGYDTRRDNAVAVYIYERNANKRLFEEMAEFGELLEAPLLFAAKGTG